MCTVTFTTRKNGYALAMNRDEKFSRPRGLPPAQVVVNGRKAVCPSEASGGTWIGVNEAGVTLALINWYSVKASVQGANISRGDVVKHALGSIEVPTVQNAILSHDLKKVNPFRLIGVFPASREIVEWRWNLREMKTVAHTWSTETWISSGFDEPGAEIERRNTFQSALRQSTAGSAEWLRRLHRSHTPAKGPYSTCMHRNDAESVSFTEVRVSSTTASMRHQAGPPCLGCVAHEITLALIR